MIMDLKALIKFFIFSALLFINVNLWAQPGGHGKPCPKPPCPPSIPISGIEILLAGGAALGIRKLIQNKRSKP